MYTFIYTKIYRNADNGPKIKGYISIEYNKIILNRYAFVFVHVFDTFECEFPLFSSKDSINCIVFHE